MEKSRLGGGEGADTPRLKNDVFCKEPHLPGWIKADVHAVGAFLKAPVSHSLWG